MRVQLGPISSGRHSVTIQACILGTLAATIRTQLWHHLIIIAPICMHMVVLNVTKKIYVQVL